MDFTHIFFPHRRGSDATGMVEIYTRTSYRANSAPRSTPDTINMYTVYKRDADAMGAALARFIRRIFRALVEFDLERKVC